MIRAMRKQLWDDDYKAKSYSKWLSTINYIRAWRYDSLVGGMLS
jgi:hypothetical protein